MEMHDLFSLDYRSRRTTHPYGAYVVTVIEQLTRRSDGIFRRYRPHFSVHIELFIFNDPLHKTMMTQNCNIQQFGIYTQVHAPRAPSCFLIIVCVPACSGGDVGAVS